MEARMWLKQLAVDAGFATREDAVGNTFIRWQGTDPNLSAVGTGSHTDAIPHAGMYDGTVGVLGGLEALRSLREAGFVPKRSLELLIFQISEKAAHLSATSRLDVRKLTHKVSLTIIEIL